MPHSLRRIWAWPIAIALVTASGLASALVADGWGDRWSWFALGVPVAAMAWFGWRRRPPRAARADDEGPR